MNETTPTHKLMPLKVTLQMHEAAEKSHNGKSYPADMLHGPRAMREDEYTAMLAIAPAPEVGAMLEAAHEALREALSASESVGHPLGGAAAQKRASIAETEARDAIDALAALSAAPATQPAAAVEPVAQPFLWVARLPKNGSWNQWFALRPAEVEKYKQRQALEGADLVELRALYAHPAPQQSPVAQPVAMLGGATARVRARTLLSLLWRKQDAAGISMGRSYESVLLEAAFELMGPPEDDGADLARCDAMELGAVVGETRDYLSSLLAKRLGFPAPQQSPSEGAAS